MLVDVRDAALVDVRTAALVVVLRDDDRLLELVLVGEDDLLVDAYTNPPLRRFTGPDTLVRFV